MLTALTLIGWVSIFELSGIPPPPALSSTTTTIPDRLLLSVAPQSIMAGRSVRTIVRVDRHAANRLLRVEIDGPSYAASAERQLDGEDAQRTYEMWWRTLPAGEYIVTVEVEGSSGVRHRVKRALTVMGMTDDSIVTPLPGHRGRPASTP